MFLCRPSITYISLPIFPPLSFSLLSSLPILGISSSLYLIHVLLHIPSIYPPFFIITYLPPSSQGLVFLSHFLSLLPSLFLSLPISSLSLYPSFLHFSSAIFTLPTSPSPSCFLLSNLSSHNYLSPVSFIFSLRLFNLSLHSLSPHPLLLSPLNFPAMQSLGIVWCLDAISVMFALQHL